MRFFLTFILLGSAVASAQTFDSVAAGPSILSRGSRLGTSGNEPAYINFTVGVEGVYDGTLSQISSTGAIINPNGQGAAGVSVRGTLRGVHRWKRSSIGISYIGDYVQYTGASGFNGTNQSLSLDFTQQVNKKLSTSYKLVAGTSNRPYGGAPGLPGSSSGNGLETLDPNFLAVPAQELFNNQVYYVQGEAGFDYRFNNRLSFHVSGSGYGVRREAKGLGGLNGYLGNADISYRLSKRATVTGFYNFTHFEYPGSFGATDLHGFGVSYARTFGRDWEFALTARVNRTESLGLARVDLDPLVAALLGQTSGVEAFYRLNYLPGGDLRVVKRFKTSSLTFTANQGIVPGNGLYLTSQQSSASASFDYTGVRHWSFSSRFGYQEFSSVTRTANKYRSALIGLGASRTLYKTIHFTARFDYRDQFISDSTFKHNGSRISAGLAWSPRDVPLALW